MCAFQNACTKHVVGWQVRADMPGALVTSALHRALLAQRPALPGTTPSLIVHSDQGGQYVSNDYKALLRAAQAQLLAQPTRRVLRQCPTGYDPGRKPTVAPQIKELKAREWPVFADLADAQASVADYFDYYNHQRRHSSIGYQKPYQFHQQQLANISPFSPA